MLEILDQFSIWAAIDILIIAFIIYHTLLLIRGTRAAQMLTGILIVVATFLLSSIVPLTTLNWVMNKFYSSFVHHYHHHPLPRRHPACAKPHGQEVVHSRDRHPLLQPDSR